MGYFDRFLNPSADVAGTDGAWGTYPFFPSGTVVVSDIDNGLSVLRDNTVGLANRVGRLGFAVTSATAFEHGPALEVKIRRVDGRQGAASVAYSTLDGSALAGSDYQATSGTLEWAEGDDTDRTVSIPLINDGEVEGSETFSLTLSSPSLPLDGEASLAIALADDDAQPAPRRGGGGGRIDFMALIVLALLGAVRRKPWRVNFVDDHETIDTLDGSRASPHDKETRTRLFASKFQDLSIRMGLPGHPDSLRGFRWPWCFCRTGGSDVPFPQRNSAGSRLRCTRMCGLRVRGSAGCRPDHPGAYRGHGHGQHGSGDPRSHSHHSE